MGGLNVKNTIVERGLQVLAPHYCFSCGKVGSILCDYCKYDIVSEPFLGCIVCGLPSRDGICSKHDSSVERSYVVSERGGPLEAIINSLKFHNLKAAALSLAELLNERLPLLPKDTVIVPIPTVSSHIRQRGYDQVELIARHLAQLRSLPLKHMLVRVGKETQHTLDRRHREIAAEKAFVFNSSIKGVKNVPILLIDDIITTGSTVSQAASQLTSYGSTVWVAAVAYQPLD